MIAQNARSNHPDYITSFGTPVYPSEALERATAVVSFLDVALQALLSKGAPEEPGDEQVFGLGLIFSETLSAMRGAKAALHEQQSQQQTEDNDAYQKGFSAGREEGKRLILAAIAPMVEGGAIAVAEAFRSVDTYPRFDPAPDPEQDVPPHTAVG